MKINFIKHFPIIVSSFTLIFLIFMVGVVKTSIKEASDEVQVIEKITGSSPKEAQESCNGKLKVYVYEQQDHTVKEAVECIDENASPSYLMEQRTGQTPDATEYYFGGEAR